jgi:xanthine permease
MPYNKMKCIEILHDLFFRIFEVCVHATPAKSRTLLREALRINLLIHFKYVAIWIVVFYDIMRIKNKQSLGKLCAMGLQHVLIVYVSLSVVPLILGEALTLTTEQITYLISVNSLTCGIATILQAYGWKDYIGIKLPTVIGCTLIAVAPMVAIGKTYGLSAIYGALIVSGFLTFLIAPVASRLLMFFPPIVIGSIITTIGLSLIPMAINNLCVGISNLGLVTNRTILSVFVLCTIIIASKCAKKFVRNIALLLGIITGTIVAYFMRLVDFSTVQQASWFKLVYPFYFGLPKFTLSGSLTMCSVIIITVIESVGIFLALGKIYQRKMTKIDIANGVRAEGLVQIIGAILNSLPQTTFVQTVGLAVLADTQSRFIALIAGIILILLGLSPKLSALAIIVPSPVLGVVMLVLFVTIIGYGIKILFDCNLKSISNISIVACSVGVGTGISFAPLFLFGIPRSAHIIFNNGIVIGSYLAIILHFLLNPSIGLLQIKKLSQVTSTLNGNNNN